MSYEVRVQETDKYCVIHCDVSHFSPSVWKDMKTTAKAIREVYSDKIVYAVPLNTPLHNKFLKLMGFEWHGDIIGTEESEMLNVWRMVWAV